MCPWYRYIFKESQRVLPVRSTTCPRYQQEEDHRSCENLSMFLSSRISQRLKICSRKRYSINSMLKSLSLYQRKRKKFLCFFSTRFSISCNSYRFFSKATWKVFVQVQTGNNNAIQKNTLIFGKRVKHSSYLRMLLRLFHPKYWLFPTFLFFREWWCNFRIITVKYLFHECHNIFSFHFILLETVIQIMRPLQCILFFGSRCRFSLNSLPSTDRAIVS